MSVVCSALNKGMQCVGRSIKHKPTRQTPVTPSTWTKYVPCKEDVIYNIPLSYGPGHIGGPGINNRASKHESNIEILTAPGHLASHRKAYKCKAKLEPIL